MLARAYHRLLSDPDVTIWIAEDDGHWATVTGRRRGPHRVEARDFVATGGGLGLALAADLLRRADAAGDTLVVGTHGTVRRTYYERLGFHREGRSQMVRPARRTR